MKKRIRFPKTPKLIMFSILMMILILVESCMKENNGEQDLLSFAALAATASAGTSANTSTADDNPSTDDDDSSSTDDDDSSSTDDEKTVKSDAAALDTSDFTFSGSDTEDSVTGNIILPTSGENGSDISWSSDDPAIVVGDNGTAMVTRPEYGEGDVQVTLTATISMNDASTTVTFTLTVKETPESDAASVEADKNTLSIGYTNPDTSTGVTQNLSLASTGSSGTTIDWDAAYTSDGADASSVVNSSGTVTRPTYVTGDAEITLTATISKGSESDTLEFNITVLKNDPPAGYTLNYSDGGSQNFNMMYVPGGITFPTGVDDMGHSIVASAYQIAETEVKYSLWSDVYNWATYDAGGGKREDGGELYTFASAGKEGHDGTTGTGSISDEPVTYINWRDAMVWTNALTEYINYMNGDTMSCVYTSDAAYENCLRDSSDGAYGSSINYPNPGSTDDPYVNPEADGFRLPTGDEWGMAARWLGTTEPSSDDLATEYVSLDHNDDGTSSLTPGYYWTPGDYGSGAVDDYTDHTANNVVAWYRNNSSSTTHDVGGKSANTLGLHDMGGNVKEWNFDWDPSYAGTSRLTPGGSYTDLTYYLKIGLERSFGPFGEGTSLGFRIARSWK